MIDLGDVPEEGFRKAVVRALERQRRGTPDEVAMMAAIAHAWEESTLRQKDAILPWLRTLRVISQGWSA